MILLMGNAILFHVTPIIPCGLAAALFLILNPWFYLRSKGIVQGILSRNYFNSRYILKINNPTDITFIDSRCDPFFEENFEANRLGLFYKNGWYNYAHEGTQFWEVYEDENSLGQSVHIGSYRSGDVSTISWLISPKLDLSSLKNPQVAFRTSVSFPD